LLLTNDGELANRLIHPSFGVDKTYIATVKELANQALASLMSGIELDDGMVKAAKARIMDRAKNAVMVELVIHEGRNRIVRRMFDAVGSPVTALVRTKIGPVALGQQRPGVLRVINGAQLRALYTAAGL